jgi:hypothetical protein
MADFKTGDSRYPMSYVTNTPDWAATSMFCEFHVPDGWIDTVTYFDSSSNPTSTAVTVVAASDNDAHPRYINAFAIQLRNPAQTVSGVPVANKLPRMARRHAEQARCVPIRHQRRRQPQLRQRAYRTAQ